MNYWVLLICAGSITLIALSIYSRTANKITTNTSVTKSNTMKEKTENPYIGIRKLAFDVRPSQLGLSNPTEGFTAYGVIMDIDMGGGIATLVTYASGDASIYLSSGGGIIGGGQHKEVSAAAIALVKKAQLYLNHSHKATETSLPDKGNANIYFLTNKGVYLAIDKISELESNSSSFSPLFYAGNDVITELRRISENKKSTSPPY